MPREATITYEQVATFADAIKAEGLKPSARLIRERHGSGSLGTIHKLLAEYLGRQNRPIEATLALPPALQRSILDFMAAELTMARAELEAKLAETQTAAADLANENERQAGQLDVLQGMVETLAGERATLEGRAVQLESDLTTAREETARERKATDAARTDLAGAQLKLQAMPRLEDDLAVARGALQDVDHRRQTAERDLAVCTSERKAIEQAKIEAVKAAEIRLADAQEQQRQALAAASEVRKDLLRTSDQLAAAQAMRADESMKAASKIGALEGTIATLEKQLGAASKSKPDPKKPSQ